MHYLLIVSSRSTESSFESPRWIDPKFERHPDSQTNSYAVLAAFVDNVLSNFVARVLPDDLCVYQQQPQRYKGKHHNAPVCLLLRLPKKIGSEGDSPNDREQKTKAPKIKILSSCSSSSTFSKVRNLFHLFMTKKPSASKKSKPWCWYCDREFDDMGVLIQHQKARHFKCSQCSRRLNSGSGLVIHLAQVHKITMERIPNCIPGHDTPEVEIYGMEGIPPGDLERHQKGLPSVPFKRPKFLESGGLLPLLAAQKASAGAISITGKSDLFDTSTPTASTQSISPPMQPSPLVPPPVFPVGIPPPPMFPPPGAFPFGMPPGFFPPPLHMMPMNFPPPPMPNNSFPPPPVVNAQQSIEEDQPRYLPPRQDPKTGKMLSGQRLVVLHPETSLEEQRAALSRYRPKR